ncbi:MAG: glycoside hydrolase family 88 protein [Clostridia bacterium]|nr:glycoside hydrolase family 88 protein [Clostridia bacterium]
MKTIDLALKVNAHYREVMAEKPSAYYVCVANYGMVNIAEITGEGSEADTFTRALLKKYPNEVQHGRYNFPSYAVSGIAKPRAVLSGMNDDLDQVIEYANEIMTATRDKNGIIGHPNKERSERVWIDVAFAVTPFLLFAGLKTGNQVWIDEAAKQTLDMYDLFMDHENGLLHQSRDFCGVGKISEDHWSRGNGWGIVPLAELCAWLPDNHPEKARCVKYLQDHCAALLPFQSENGMWRQEISVVEYEGLDSYEETSGTGLIAYAMAVGMRSGALDEATYLPVFRRAIEGIVKISIREDYSIYNSCPGCLCPGDGTIRAYLSHKPTFKDEPHGAGPVIMALAEAHRMGITEIEGK